MMTDRDGAYLLPHYQSGITVVLTHLTENQYENLVPVVLADRCENYTKAVPTHWAISLLMPSLNVLASSV